jgi:PPP family 3-phenylpropionic acid transporter
MSASDRASALPRFIVLFAALYAAFGVASPFLPAFLSARGLSAEQVGVILGAGTAVRLITAPLAGRVGDLMRSLRGVLVLCTVLAACAALGYLPAQGFWTVFAVGLLHAAALAPITILADALALGAATASASASTSASESASSATGRRRFEYGWVRGTGSAAFIVGTLLTGQAVSAVGLDAIVWLQAMLLGAAAWAACRVPELVHQPPALQPELLHDPAVQRVGAPAGGFLILLRLPLFRNLVLVAALVLGSHAMHDTFAVIRWSAAGISPATASLLWSEAVAAEVLVFFVIGPPLVTRLTPAGAVALAALAGVLRWSVMAQSSDVVVLALVQPLHGMTFALLHLACMRLIARTVPPGLEGTAQAIYATVGIGLATALLTFISGVLYGRLGAQGFWLMAALCALALPLTHGLRTPRHIG